MNALICLAAATVFQFAANPPRSAGPHVWWHWVNGNVSKAGITADLESMADAGICGAQVIDVGCGIPAGTLRFDTDEWYEHVRFAASEAKRLGLSLTVLNCSGFANSGGPWVTPADSMKFTTFSKTPAKGPSKFSGLLPRTKDDHGFYRDIAVFAIPAPVEERLPLGFSYELGFKRTFAESGTLHVEVSKDGKSFEKYADLPVWLSYFGVADFARRFVLFPEARDYRAIRATFDGTKQKVEVKDIRLERSARIANLTGKTFRRREPVTADETVVPPSQALGKADVIDLTAKMADDGRLDWNVPAGDWTIVRFGYVSTGEKNDPPSENGLGLEVDKLDPAAVARHFDAYCGKICRKLGPLAGRPESGFNAVFVDNIEVCSENWTHGFEKEFAKRRGYSIFPYLPVLTGRIVGSLDESERFLWDYRRVIADMFAENYIGTMQRLCREHGLEFAFEPYGNCPSDNLQLGRYIDIPMGEFWAGAGTDTIAIGSGNVKFSASVKHVWGQRIMAAESFTAAPGPKSGRWLTTPWAVKGQCDNAYASGANRIVYHRFAHQPWTDPKRIPGATMGPWGMHFERTQTWWEEGKEFIRYQTRCQNVLQQPGVWRADALFFCGEEAPNAGGNPIAERNEFALDAGYKYDVCSADALAALKVEDGKLVSPGGTCYSLFVLPDRKEMSVRVLAELERFVAGGVKVCFTARPVRAAGLVDYPMSDADLTRRFASLEPKMLRMTPEQALVKIGLEPDFKVVSGVDEKDAKRICWMHRMVGGEEMYFVGNPSHAGRPVICAFRVAEGEAELWDAESGKAWRPRQFRRNGAWTEVELPFADTGSFFVCFRKGIVTSPVFPTYETVSETTVEGPWTVDFPHGFLPNQLAVGANEVRTFDTLSDWSKSDEKGIRYFSGSAVYRKTIAAPQLKPGGRLILDLGKVKDFATVTVNGKTYSALWKAPFTVDVTEALGASRELDLEIRVTNLWPNRLIGDDFLSDDCAWSGDETKPDRHNVGLAALPDWLVNGTERTSGRVTFSTWRHWTKTDKLLESGLFGPVLLRGVKERCEPFWCVYGETVPPTEAVKALPPELRTTKEEAQALTRRMAEERATVGYRTRMPKIWGRGHSFYDWTKGEVWEKHREFFGLTPYGTRGVEMGKEFPDWMKCLSKVCVSNEDVIDWRVTEWEKAGLPEYASIAENDGVAGYCRCEKCRALDADLPGERFLVNKTDRYVNFWNRLLTKMRAKRPDVKGHLFIYSVLRHPPRRERISCPENFLGSYVPTFYESLEQTEAELKAWKAAGLKYFYLRPNYLQNRTVLPYGREKFICDVHHLFRRYGSLGDFFDSCTTVAATKFEIYAALRLCAKPETTFVEISADWYASFGAASDCVQRYYEQVRARCDREFPKIVARLAEKGIEYVDDSHFSRHVHELHTVAELKDDLAILESFDGKGLEGEAKRKFEDLKLCARHYVMTLETLRSKSPADKARLIAFRAQHKTLFSQNWWRQWYKGEFWLWDESKSKADCENAAITTWMDDWELNAAAVRAHPGVVLRFDDAHPVEQWRELAAAFDAEGMKASFAVPMGFVNTDEQRTFLREAAANGHEIMDHACHHGVFYDVCRDSAEFESARKLPCVAEADGKDRFIGFRFAFDRKHPGNRVFRGLITNGVLVVSTEEAKRLHRPNKVFVPSLDRFFGFFDAPDGRIQLRSFYRPQEQVRGIDVPEGELLLCDHRAFMVCEDALRYQAKLSREAFRRCGLPDPKTWIQPGGWEPWVSVDLFRKVYAKEFGYTAADCIPGSGPWNGDPKAPDPEIARYTFRPTSYFDSASVTQESIRKEILTARAAGCALCFISHMQPSPKMKGGWSEWMDETRALLKWLKENEIPVRTMSVMADHLWGTEGKTK